VGPLAESALHDDFIEPTPTISNRYARNASTKKTTPRATAIDLIDLPCGRCDATTLEHTFSSKAVTLQERWHWPSTTSGASDCRQVEAGRREGEGRAQEPKRWG